MMKSKTSREANPLVLAPFSLTLFGRETGAFKRREGKDDLFPLSRAESHERGVARAQRNSSTRRAAVARGASSGRDRPV